MLLFLSWASCHFDTGAGDVKNVARKPDPLNLGNQTTDAIYKAHRARILIPRLFG